MITRPSLDEYPAYAIGYVAAVPEGTDVLQLLADAQESTYQLFTSLNEAKASFAYAEGKWTVKQVLGHMIDTERVFAFRAFCFSRAYVELPGFDQDEYIENSDYENRTLQSLAEEFKLTRQSNLYMFKALTEEQLLKSGRASNNPATVRALVYLAAGHEQYHLRILKEKYL